MTFLPLFGNLRKMCTSDCGTITFMNENSQFLDSLTDKKLSLHSKDVGSSPVAFHFFLLFNLLVYSSLFFYFV